MESKRPVTQYLSEVAMERLLAHAKHAGVTPHMVLDCLLREIEPPDIHRALESHRQTAASVVAVMRRVKRRK